MVTSKKNHFFEAIRSVEDLPRSGAWKLHTGEHRPKTPKDVFEYGEFNGELRMIMSMTDCCYLDILLFVLM